MNDEEQTPEYIERSAEPDLVDPDAVVLDEGVISAEALEPELSVSPDTLELQEPVLGAVEISRDTAEAASLDAAAAEATAVAAEAEKAGTLVGGPLATDTPTVDAAPGGTAPAGGRAGDAPEDTVEAADSTEEIVTDSTTVITENAAPHPEPDEILADEGRGSRTVGPTGA